MKHEDTRPTPYPLRMSPELKKQLTLLAEKNNRSLHAQIIASLSEAVEQPATLEELRADIKEIKKTLKNIERHNNGES